MTNTIHYCSFISLRINFQYDYMMDAKIILPYEFLLQYLCHQKPVK